MFPSYDVIVVGAGHAGCEAAMCAATMGARTLLITSNLATIGQMSCNPAMGGIAKGQIVREIDALGGYSGIVTDKSSIQFRMLNTSKGPAVWSPRAQCDRQLFAKTWRETLENNKNIDFWQDTVVELLIKDNTVYGIKTLMQIEIESKTVVIASGTFLNGRLFIGDKTWGGGRISEQPACGLTQQLIRLGFETGRMKTGTPPRIDGRSVDYNIITEQKGDINPGHFSFYDNYSLLTTDNQKSCFLTYTNSKVHDVLRSGFDRSPLFNKTIQGKGPRYCPSIEDKIVRFADKDRHQIFIEPEGWNTVECYVNGFSSSLPEDIQFRALRQIEGLGNVKMIRPAYAVEYDYFPAVQLHETLETKLINNLYFAGQINGTTGYEEAAGQGLVSGINACLRSQNKDVFTLKRSNSYIGVLINDIITKESDEPYRMFTSRSEFRLSLRQNNADIRLTEMSYDLGLAKQERYNKVLKKRNDIKDVKDFFYRNRVKPEDINDILTRVGECKITEAQTLSHLLTRPNISTNVLMEIEGLSNVLNKYSDEVLEEVEIQIKYESYIEKEKILVDKFLKLDDMAIPSNFDYSLVKSLSNEGREKLMIVRPSTIGQASKISGVSTTDVNILTVYISASKCNM